jgi:hypothetical protein
MSRTSRRRSREQEIDPKENLGERAGADPRRKKIRGKRRLVQEGGDVRRRQRLVLDGRAGATGDEQELASSRYRRRAEDLELADDEEEAAAAARRGGRRPGRAKAAAVRRG